MTSIRNLLTVTTVLLLAACGGEPEPGPQQAPPAEPAEEATAPAEPAAEAEQPATTTQEREPEVVEESDAEDADATVEDEIVLAPAETAARPEPVPQRFSEGQHYTVLTTAQGTSSSPDVVEIAEVFWYGCPHCYNFDPFVTKWEEQLPEGVQLVRVPVMWNPTNEIHARMFYTAEALGKLDEMHKAIFKEMHLNGKTLTTESEIEAFFGQFGVSPEDFRKTFRSFQVETNLKKARNLTMRYRVQSVPLVVVNGKYVVNGPAVKTFEDMIDVSNELVARELAAL